MHDYYSFVFLSDLLIWFANLIYLSLQWEEVLCSGFDLMVPDPSDKRGNDMYVSLLLRITRSFISPRF